MQFEDLTETDNDQLLNRIETMDMYPTYKSAKIKHPECDIYEQNCTPMGKLFTPGLMHSVMDGSYNNKCNPADHCMTVEKFLADGHKFVEGDLYLEAYGKIREVYSTDSYIMDLKAAGDCSRYILRAAALETKETKRTKESYVKRNYSTAWQAAKDHEERVEFLYRQSDLGEVIKGNNWKAIQSPSEAAQYHFDLYRKIETPIEWWEDANDLLGYLANLSLDDDGILQLTMKNGQVGFGMSRDKWCDFARILLEQGE